MDHIFLSTEALSCSYCDVFGTLTFAEESLDFYAKQTTGFYR